MRVFTDRNYGADIDGNRGYSSTEIELDLSDDEAIREMIREEFNDTACYVYCTDEGSIEVEISDYFTDDEIEKMEDLYYGEE